MEDFLSVRDLDHEGLIRTFDLASEMKRHPRSYSATLQGHTLAMIFEKPSLRTRSTFDVGIQQLGGYSLCLLPAEIQLGKRESVHDVAKNLERMVQCIMVRTFAHQIVVDMAKHSCVPVINGLTDYLHPCQAMADYLTIREVKGTLEGLKICYAGDGNNVAHSLMFAGAMLGVNVTVACPEGFEPDATVCAESGADAEHTGASIVVTNDLLEGVTGADVVYTDTWASMGQEAEAQDRDALFRPYQVNAALMAQAKPDATFMHCLPAHRGDEVTDEVMDSPCSVVFQQAENRLHVQKALMYQLMT